MSTFPFPLSHWLTPATTGLHRLPMASALAPFDGVESARAGTSPWVRSLDGTWLPRLPASPVAVGAADVADAADVAVSWPETADVPGSWLLPADPAQRDAGPIYLNVRMPFAGQPPFVPADN